MHPATQPDETQAATRLNILGVSGSPRADAATSALVRAALLGAETVGDATTSFVSLAEKRIGYCDGCRACVAADSCVIDDDMQHLYGQLLAADAVILGSPVYYGAPSALCKAFMERVQGLGIREKRLRLKVGGAIAVGASRNGGQESTLAAMHLWYHILDMVPIGITAPVSQWGVTACASSDPASIHDDVFDLKLVDRSLKATQIAWMYGQKIAVVAQIMRTGRSASGLDLPHRPYGYDIPESFPAELDALGAAAARDGTA